VSFLDGEPVYHSCIERLRVAPILLEKAARVLGGVE